MTRTTARRDFLLTGLAGATNVIGAPAAQIVDTHIHLYDPTRPEGVPWPPKDNALLYKPTLPADYEKLVRPLGVTGAVVVEASAWLQDNDWILNLAKEHRFLVGFVGHLDNENFSPNLDRLARNPLFRGIRMGGTAIHRDMPSLNKCKQLAERDLVLDAIGDSAMISDLIDISTRVPKLRISVNHVPGEPTGWNKSAETRKVFRQLAQNPKVYAKVSGVVEIADQAKQRELLDEVWEIFTDDRVFYGSNWPVSNRYAPYGDVLRTMTKYLQRRGPKSGEKYFWKNSKACYKWLDRA